MRYIYISKYQFSLKIEYRRRSNSTYGNLNAIKIVEKKKNKTK